MKLFKENKSLGVLLIVSIIYVGITFLFINPLRMKNNDLEKQKSEILTLHQQRNTINTISKKKKTSGRYNFTYRKILEVWLI